MNWKEYGRKQTTECHNSKDDNIIYGDWCTVSAKFMKIDIFFFLFFSCHYVFQFSITYDTMKPLPYRMTLGRETGHSYIPQHHAKKMRLDVDPSLEQNSASDPIALEVQDRTQLSSQPASVLSMKTIMDVSL
jgi:hypothetical protein